MKTLIFFLLLCLFPVKSTYATEDQGDLMRDLLVVDYWNQKIEERLPVTFNNFLQGGYINMPSARMGKVGEIGLGYSRVHPYINYNLRVQLASNLEISGSYRVFQGLDDPILTPLGFGDLSDKGVNLKLAFFHPEDSGYTLPGLAIGLVDFMGTQNFYARYLVLTQVILKYHLEISLGYGTHRIHNFFGGVNWMPFRGSRYCLLDPLCFVAEYDATPYKNPKFEKHPKGRKKSSSLNVGVKYRLLDHLDLSLSYVRGQKFAFSFSAFYDFGHTRGFLPKIDDPLPYRFPINNVPLGEERPEVGLAGQWICPFDEQGFRLLQLWISHEPYAQKFLWLKVVNNSYQEEACVRERLTALVVALTPVDIDEVIIAIESEGFPVHEYRFRMEFVRMYAAGEIGEYEINLLTPLRDFTRPPQNASLFFQIHRDFFNIEFLPKAQSLFGSSKGKFKYSYGLQLGINGFLWGDLYYSIAIGKNLIMNLQGLNGIDRLNPSQLINVRTDSIEYFKRRGITLDQAYVQKIWNLGRGWFSKAVAGYFEEAYGGFGGEFLYYPVNSNLALGVEAAYLRKRAYSGIAFTDRVRKLHGFKVTFKRFIGSQVFANLYYNFCDYQLDFRVKVGKFLANDWGSRFEISRYFPSGLRLTIWYTLTTARDRINGKTYYDKGISFSMPLDIFYTRSERDRFGQGISAWQRDVGAIGEQGLSLYDLINQER